MRDAIDKARGVVAWALTALLVLTALRVVVNLAFIENGYERGFGVSAAAATDYETLVIAALVGLALAIVVSLGRSGDPGLTRTLLTVDAGALVLIAVLAAVGAFAVFAADVSGLQQFLGFLSRLLACALLVAVAYGCYLLGRSPELARARPQPTAYGYPQAEGYGGPAYQGQGMFPGQPYAPPGPYAAQQDPHQNVQGAGARLPLGGPVPYQQGQPQYASQPEPQQPRPQAQQPSGSHAWSPAASGPGAPASPPTGYYQPPQSAYPGDSPYGAPRYGQQYSQQYGEQYGQRYGQSPQEPPTYGQPYAQQYAPSQYEQQHGYAQAEEAPAATYPTQSESEQGQPLDSISTTGESDDTTDERAPEDDQPNR